MACFVSGALDGAAVMTPRRPPRRSSPYTPRHVLNRRNALWLRAIETGLHDPAAGRDRVYHPTELAPIFRVSLRTVELGISAARRLRDTIDRARA